jgi:uncharacterized cupredoxin-like copper-binding protein
MRLRTRTSGALAVLLLAAACGGDDGAVGTGAGSATITAELSEFAIELSSSTAPAGEVTLEGDNVGAAEHELVVIRTDLPAGELPTDDSGGLDEEGLDVIDEIEDIAPGESSTLTVSLEEGHHALVCNLPGHYGGGMHADLDVTAAAD